MKVLIQGAGITGLTLARELNARGIDFLIVERAQEIKPVGAGITLGANALSCLARTLDLNQLRERGKELPELVVTDQRGRPLMSTASQVEGIPHAGVAIHRHDLHECLLEGLPSDRILLGTQITSFNQDADGVTVVLSNGRSEQFDYLVGADGLRSKIRETLFPEARTSYSGYTCWRAVLDQPLKNPDRAVEMWGPGRRLGLVAIGHNQTYAFLTLNVSREPQQTSTADLPVSKVVELFRDFDDEAPAVIAAIATQNQPIHNDLEEITLPRWHVGRVQLLGDAAHAMTPNLGQGAAMGIEDASILARIWESNTSPASLDRFEALRRPRVNWIQAKSRELGKISQSENATFIWLRNQLFKLTPQAVVKRNMLQILAFETNAT